MASRISSKVCAAFLFVSVLACGSKPENKVKPLAGAGVTGDNTAAVANDPTKAPDANDPNAKPKDPGANVTATPSTPEAAAGDATKYVLENSNLLVVIDVKKMVASPFMADPAVKAQIDQLKNDEDFKKLAAAGVDPFTNVDKIVVSGDATKEAFAVAVTGTFDAVKAGEAAKAEMAKEGGKGLVEVIGTNTLILADRTEDIASAKAAKGTDGSPALKDAMALADTSRAMYVVANLPPEASAAAAGSGIPGLQTAKNAVVGLNIDKGIDLMVAVQLGSDADATSAKAGIDAMLPMAAGMVPPEVMSALKIEAKGANLSISLVLNEAQLKQLQETAQKMGVVPPMGAPMPDMEEKEEPKK